MSGVLRSVLLVWVFLLLAGRSSPAATVAFMADGETDSLYSVDLNNGSATLVGTFGIDASFVGLAYDSINDDLYMSSISGGPPAASSLYRVNQSSGAATFVGNTGITNVTGLAFDAMTGDIFASSGADDALYRVNPTNASSTLVGSFGLGVGGHGLAYDQANSTLYLTDAISDNLYTINPSSGSATLVGALNQTVVVGLAFDPNSNDLFGVDVATDQLMSVDIATGNSTAIGSLGFNANNVGLAINASAIPEPSCGVLLAVGLVGCIMRRSRSGVKVL